jgi:hypothetical protein
MYVYTLHALSLARSLFSVGALKLLVYEALSY